MTTRTTKEIPLTEYERMTLVSMSDERLAQNFEELSAMQYVPDLDWFEAIEAEMVERVLRSR